MVFLEYMVFLGYMVFLEYMVFSEYMVNLEYMIRMYEYKFSTRSVGSQCTILSFFMDCHPQTEP